MKARILFWSAILILQFLSLRFLSAGDLGDAAPAVAVEAQGPILCGTFLPDLIKQTKSQNPAVAKALRTLYGASMRMSAANRKSKRQAVEITPEIKKAYEIISNWFRDANDADLEKYLEAGRTELLADLRELATTINTHKQSKSELSPLISEASAKLALITKELDAWTEFASVWKSNQEAQEGDVEKAGGEDVRKVGFLRALLAFDTLLSQKETVISDETRSALRAAHSSSTETAVQVAALSAAIDATVIRLSTAKAQQDSNIAQLRQAQKDLPGTIDSLMAQYNELNKASRQELFLVALEELRIRKGYEDIQEELRLKKEAADLRAERAAEAQARETKNAADRSENAKKLRKAQSEELFAFFDKTLEGRKFPSAGLAAIDNFRGAAYLGDENVSESAADLNFSLAIFTLITAAKKKGFQDDLIIQIFPIWMYGGAKSTNDMPKLVALMKKVGANRSFAFISKKVLEFNDQEAGVWSRVVSFVMSFKNEKPPANPVVGAMMPNSKRNLTKVERQILKDVYLDLQNFQARKLGIRDRKVASTTLADWMMVTGNAVESTTVDLSKSTIWNQTETGIRNRTRRTMSFTWRWIARPAIIASLVLAGGTAAITEAMNYAHNNGVPYVHETPIASLPSRAQSWAAIDEASNWADGLYGMEWQRVAGVETGASFVRAQNWTDTSIAQARTWIDSIVNPTAPSIQNGTGTAAPAAPEASPSIPSSIFP